jgi:hypothetical protein
MAKTHQLAQKVTASPDRDTMVLTPQIIEKSSKFDFRVTRSRFRNSKCYRTSRKLQKPHV